MKRPQIHWHEGGDGPAVVLINGLACSGIVWPKTLVRRLEQRFRVLRPDNRGSGWSRSAPTPFLVEDMADDVAAVLEATGSGSATVLGLSLGGMIAQELALRHPARVGKLILVATRPPAPEHVLGDPLATGLMVAGLAPGETLRDLFLRQWASFTGPGFVDDHPDRLSELVDALLARPTPRALLRQQLRAAAAWGGARRLAALAAPTVVVHGAVDKLSLVRNGMRLAQLIPDAAYVELADVGHAVPYEAPERLAELVEQPTYAAYATA